MKETPLLDTKSAAFGTGVPSRILVYENEIEVRTLRPPRRSVQRVSYEQIAQVFVNRGIVYAELAMRKGDAAAAIDGLQDVIERTDLWLAHFVLGTAYVQSERYADAVGEFEMCGTRRGEATILFMDDVPTIRYLAPLDRWLSRARAGATVLP